MGTLESKSYKSTSGTEITIRTATEDDAIKLNNLVIDIFKTSDYLVTQPDEFATYTDQQQKERIKKYEQDSGGLPLVAETSADLIGTLDFQNGKRRRIAHKGSFGMSVRSDWRHQGVGRMLLTSLIEWVKAHPTIEVINLGVLEDNKAAIALYSSLGFEQTGREPFGIKLSESEFMADLTMSLKVDK